MSIEALDGMNCCGMADLNGFYGTTNNWMEDLYRTASDDGGHDAWLPAIIVFSGADYQTSGSTPFSFAKWLRQQGERVINTGRVKNSNSGRKIQGFMWTPSAKFRKKFDAYCAKQEENREKEEKNASNSSPIQWW